MAECKHCDAEITFIKNKKERWVPTDPRTGKHHVCDLEQKCDDCGTPFKGSPYMKLCPVCFKTSQPNTQGFRKPMTDANQHPPRPDSREAVKMPKGHDDDYFDDIPF